ncbi:acyl carrier protein [Streptomyces sp. NPDC002825]|uniref:acyl carrier protein n=1 Tax=Streptomyces sp. NPDC002825 TaxID=3154666 RepID=UPI0033323500
MTITPPDADRTELREVVRQAWEKGLGRADFSDDDYFFSIGANSLDALRVASALKAATGRKVPVRMLYAHQTVNQLADALAAAD